MNENTNMHVENFMKTIFGSLVTTTTYDSGGAIYTMTNGDANVLKWRFGDVRRKRWRPSYSVTLYVQRIPEDQVIEYSSSS